MKAEREGIGMIEVELLAGGRLWALGVVLEMWRTLMRFSSPCRFLVGGTTQKGPCFLSWPCEATVDPLGRDAMPAVDRLPEDHVLYKSSRPLLEHLVGRRLLAILRR